MADKLIAKVRRHPILSLVCVVLVFVLLLVCVPFKNKLITFNQNYIEKTDQENHSLLTKDKVDVILSNFLARVNSLFNSGPEKYAQMDFTKPNTIFDFVFANTPYYAVVRPTEMYYYFIFPEYEIWGNMNFKEIKEGKLSFAYFDSKNIENSEAKMITAEDGLSVKVISDDQVEVSYKGKSIWFKLPKAETEKPAGLTLLSDEEFVTKVQDESGIRFYMLFNKKTNSFYFVVNNELPLPEKTKPLGDKTTIGERTQFVYYSDSERDRQVLLGVNSYNIMDNNYFDGPFDQVPPRLPLRDRLYKAYPYTQYLNGLDPYGNFIDWEGSRVAISPYIDYYYPDTSPIEATVKLCSEKKDPSGLISCLTYEDKKDFHKTIPEYFYPDGRKKENPPK